MAKLFRAEVTVVYYMLAESGDEANRTAHRYAAEAVEDDDLDSIDVAEVRAVAAYESDWLDAIPYGERRHNPDNLTVHYWLEDRARAEAEAGIVRPAPGQMGLKGLEDAAPEATR